MAIKAAVDLNTAQVVPFGGRWAIFTFPPRWEMVGESYAHRSSARRALRRMIAAERASGRRRRP